jgi:hypothetical protein
MAKTFKTISGALKSIVGNLEHHQAMRAIHSKVEQSHEEKVKQARDNLREAINRVLPQVGITETVAIEEKPSLALARIKAGLTDARKTKAVDECLKFLRNFRVATLTVCAVVSDTKSVSGKTLYRVNGFSRSDHSKRYVVVVECDDSDSPFGKAEAAIGDKDICFHASSNLGGDDQVTIIDADREHLLNKLLDPKVIDERFETKAKERRAEYLARRKAAKATTTEAVW